MGSLVNHGEVHFIQVRVSTYVCRCENLPNHTYPNISNIMKSSVEAYIAQSMPLQWRHVSVKASPITGNWTVCWAVCLGGPYVTDGSSRNGSPIHNVIMQESFLLTVTESIYCYYYYHYHYQCCCHFDEVALMLVLYISCINMQFTEMECAVLKIMLSKLPIFSAAIYFVENFVNFSE